MLKSILITLLIIGLVAGGGMAWAKYKGYCDKGDMAGYISYRVSEKLDLDDSQKSNLEALVQKFRDMRENHREKRAAMSTSVKELLASDTLDRHRVHQILDEKQESMSARKDEMVDAVADFTDSLNQEQRTKLSEMIAKRMEHGWRHARWAH